MITTTNTAATSASTAATASTVTPKADAATDPAAAQDRFLKLLVAQLNNQDPMNPLDNAQMTSQIAQINTVTGIQQLNETVKGMVSQFANQQLMAGSAMVGRVVMVEGNTLARNADTGVASAGFDLSGSAASVTVQVLDASGKELGTVEMGSLNAGRHSFEWDASAYQGKDALRFKVLSTNGKADVANTPLSIDQVTSINLDNGAMTMQLAGGATTTFSTVKAIL
ncbi:MAG: flagellar hook capping FlgD N-terminal domain-containing protein [Burkholderiaceae bacterium]|nr:flagellar hook capping FlgD N-terminal domain-containing protein [Burkholderiaceae bacterium]